MRFTLSLGLLLLAVASRPAVAQENRFVLMPILDRSGSRETVAVVSAAVRSELASFGTVIDRPEARAVLRRLRLRRLEDAQPGSLATIESELAADWLVEVAILEVREFPVAGVVLAARALSVADESMRYGLVTRTGMDGLHLLGTGVISDPVELIRREMPRLISQVAIEAERTDARASKVAVRGRGPGPGLRVAVVPLTSLVETEALLAADTGTAVLRFVLHGEGFDLVPDVAVAEVLRQNSATRWGDLTVEARTDIARELNARVILTGSVDEFTAGWSGEPRPRAAVALRALEAESGRIVWSSELERDGWYRQMPFRLGRERLRAGLLEELLPKLVEDLQDSGVGRTE